MSHTSGPWRAELGETRNQRGGFGIHVGRGIVICGRACWPDRAEESEANARLIAAAPELLDALKSLVNESVGFVSLADRETHGNTNIAVMDRRISEARAAIAKAEGR